MSALPLPQARMQYHHFRSDRATKREVPVFVVGLVGFAPAEEQVLLRILREARAGGVHWRAGTFGDADAWLVNGARTAVLADGSLRVEGCGPTRAPARFELEAVDRPIAFSEPLAAPDFEPACRFRLDAADSIHAVLGRLVQWLRPLGAQLALAAQLIELEDEVAPSGVYHVTARGRLLALVDMRRDAGISPAAMPGDFHGAAWHARPSSAGFVPDNFQRVSLSVLMWRYATRTSRDLLPERYREKTIHYRRPPRVPHRLMRDSHLFLLRELAFGPCSFEQLQRRLGAPEVSLAQDLAALYLVGSITVNPARARVRPSSMHSRPPADHESRHSARPSRAAIGTTHQVST